MMLRFSIPFLARVHAHTIDVTPMPKSYQVFDRLKFILRKFRLSPGAKEVRWYEPRQA